MAVLKSSTWVVQKPTYSMKEKNMGSKNDENIPAKSFAIFVTFSKSLRMYFL